MIIERNRDGTTVWKFYRKQYRKARYCKWGERALKSLDKDIPGWNGSILW